jgi:hypothetical protein
MMKGVGLQAYQVTKKAFPLWIFFAIILIKHNEQENFQSVWVYQLENQPLVKPLFVQRLFVSYNYLCTGGAYYVTYSFRFFSNKSGEGGGGRGSFT